MWVVYPSRIGRSLLQISALRTTILVDVLVDSRRVCVGGKRAHSFRHLLPSVRLYQCGSHWMDFRAIWYLSLRWKFFENIQWLTAGKNIGHFTFIVAGYINSRGPGSSVGIATGYGLDGPGIESRWGRYFSAPVQTGPGAHPASCTMGIGSFPGVKSGRGVMLTPHTLLVPWSWKSRAIPLLPLWAVRPVQSLSVYTRVYFTLTYINSP